MQRWCPFGEPQVSERAWDQDVDRDDDLKMAHADRPGLAGLYQFSLISTTGFSSIHFMYQLAIHKKRLCSGNVPYGARIIPNRARISCRNLI